MTLTPEALEEIKARADLAPMTHEKLASLIEDLAKQSWSRTVANALAHNIEQIPTLIKALEDRDAEIERLREALEPFATAANKEDKSSQQWNGVLLPDDSVFDLEMRYFRAARAAMDGGA